MCSLLFKSRNQIFLTEVFIFSNMKPRCHHDFAENWGDLVGGEDVGSASDNGSLSLFI